MTFKELIYSRCNVWRRKKTSEPSTTTKRALTVERNNRLRNFHKSLVRPANVYERVTRDTVTLTCQKLGPRSKINHVSSMPHHRPVLSLRMHISNAFSLERVHTRPVTHIPGRSTNMTQNCLQKVAIVLYILSCFFFFFFFLVSKDLSSKI